MLFWRGFWPVAPYGMRTAKFTQSFTSHPLGPTGVPSNLLRGQHTPPTCAGSTLSLSCMAFALMRGDLRSTFAGYIMPLGSRYCTSVEGKTLTKAQPKMRSVPSPKCGCQTRGSRLMCCVAESETVAGDIRSALQQQIQIEGPCPATRSAYGEPVQSQGISM